MMATTNHIVLFTGLFFFCVCFSAVLCQNNYKRPIYCTKTPYFWVKEFNESIVENQYGTAVYNGETCALEGLDVLFRHGGRYPTLHWITDMSALKTKLAGDEIVVQRYPFIKNWMNPFPAAKESMLSILGETEMISLGHRFGRRFKAAFNVHHSQSTNIDVSVTRKSRTRTSSEFFLKGLNETVHLGKESPTAKEDNVKLRFYDYCHKYITEVEGNSKTQMEYKTFLFGPEMTQVVHKIETKLGSNNITPDEVLVMHQICIMELGLINSSQWCSLFDIEDLLVIDYLQSIQTFYESEYAYPINWQQSCPYTSQIFKKYDNLVKQGFGRTASIHLSFVHAETVLPILTAFGLSNDSQKLLASNYNTNRDRKYKESHLAPFSANIAFALYGCQHNNAHLIKIFVNEDETLIPACSETICNYSDFKTFYDKIANCNFDQICENKSIPPPVG